MSEITVDAICQYCIGVLVPSSNTKLEPAIQRILERINANNGRRICIHANYTRVRVTQVSLDESSTAQFGIENMLHAASLLVDAGVDAIAWAGTSAGWLGTENDRALCAAITQRFRIPATTTTLALLEYMHTYTQQKLPLVTPFVQEINNAIRTTFAKEGIDVVDDRCLSITDNTRIGKLTDNQIKQMAKDVISFVDYTPDISTMVLSVTATATYVRCHNMTATATATPSPSPSSLIEFKRGYPRLIIESQPIRILGGMQASTAGPGVSACFLSVSVPVWIILC